MGVKDAYIESTMKGKKSISPEMAEMVQLCLDSSAVDIGSLYADNVASYGNMWINVFDKSSLEFASYLAKNNDKLNSRPESTLKAIEEYQD